MKSLAWVILAHALAVSATGEVASWYGYEHAGRTMANGQPFDPQRMTCASWHHPLGSKVKVSTAKRSVIVTVTDRGPATWTGANIDLSRRAFSMLAPLNRGHIRVTVKRIRS